MKTRSDCVGVSCCILFLVCGTTPADEPAAKAPEVTVARPVVREVTDYVDFTGHTDALETVNLQAWVTGYLTRVSFKEGTEVKQGDLLFEIDPRPYQAEMDRAQAGLRLAEARLQLADAVHKRAAADKTATREEVDRTFAERTEAEAGVLAAKAGVEVARLNLEFTRVTAPISGQIGRRFVDPGNLVTADKTRLATIVGRDPLCVYTPRD